MTTTRDPDKPKIQRAPAGLGAGGRALWRAIADDHHLDGPQLVQLTEACRMKDRLDEMDRIIAGKGVLELMRFRVGDVFGDIDERKVTVTVKFDGILSRANETANAMKQLIAALRLPDSASGQRPQHRGARGSYAPRTRAPEQATGTTGTVSSMERARRRAAAKTGG